MKSKIEYYKQVKVSDYLKTIVSLYNEGLDDLNKDSSSIETVQTHNFRQRIEGHDRWTKNKLRRCQEMLNNFGSIDARNLSSVNTIKQSLEESIQTEEHAAL
jgi:ferritin-like metal-binding protein YciE